MSYNNKYTKEEIEKLKIECEERAKNGEKPVLEWDGLECEYYIAHDFDSEFGHTAAGAVVGYHVDQNTYCSIYYPFNEYVTSTKGGYDAAKLLAEELIRKETSILFKYSKRQEIIEELKDDLMDSIWGLFDKYENINTLAWRQCTPYDSPSKFFVDRKFYINGFNEDGDYSLNEEYEKDSSSDLGDKDFLDFYKELLVIFDKPDDSIFKEFFGDHKQITIYRNGNRVIEDFHDHD
jgi:hypothetical protein